MPYHPSRDPTLQKQASTPLWEALSAIFYRALPLAPLPRSNTKRYYVRRRAGDETRDEKALRSVLPRAFDNITLGPTELDVLDFLLNTKTGRVLNIVGPRGVGKTTLIHFVEEAMSAAELDVPPIFLVVNGLQVDSKRGQIQDFVALLQSELAQSRKRAHPSLQTAIDKALDIFDGSIDGDTASSAFRVLRGSLPNDDLRLVNIVFDNLDQLGTHITEHALRLARDIYLRSEIGSIICLRPGSLGALQERVSARAFFGFRMRVHAPAVADWLVSLPDRFAAAAQELNAANGRFPSVHGVELNETNVSALMGRFAELLCRERRSEDDVQTILQSVSSDDTRHLVLLTRRILAHRNLPESWLLGRDTAMPSFHPIPSLVEGSNTIFRGDHEVPNLLACECNGGGIDLLLPFRILSLLTSAHPTRLDQLFEDLAILSYSREDVEKCVFNLYQTLLVGFTDADPPDPNGAMPQAAHLTQAGSYYFTHFIRMTDYAAYVVLDVPLEHERFRKEKTTDRFEPKAVSLLEYADVVRGEEARQLALLQKHPPTPALRRIADSLANGGLLTHALHEAVDAAMRRSAGTAPEIARLMRPTIEQLQRDLKNFARILSEVGNRGRKAAIPPLDGDTHVEGGVELNLRARARGDAWRVAAEVRSAERIDRAVLCLSPENLVGPAVIASVAARASAETRHVLSATFPEISGGLDRLDARKSQVATLPKSIGRVAVLSAVENRNGQVDVTLDILEDDRARSHDLGCSASLIELEKWSREQLARVGTLVVANAPFDDELRGVGVELARRALSVDGQHRLAECYKLIDTIILHSSSAVIPWEWMCPPPVAEDPDDGLPLVSDVWRTIRWPARLLHGVWKLMVSAPSKDGQPLRTIGVENDAPWRGFAPGSVRELVKGVKDTGTLHLVGHASRPGEVEVDRAKNRAGTPLVLTAQGCRAFPWRVGNVILSVCAAAAAAHDENVCVAISQAARSVVWAPLVPIRLSQAKSVDQALADYFASRPASSTEHFMRDSRDQIPLLRLYARYGVHGA